MITLGIIGILGGFALAAYALIGFVVTASTGVASGSQRVFFDLTGAGGVVAIVGGIALIVLGVRRAEKDSN